MRPALIVPLVLAGVAAAPFASRSDACSCAPVTPASNFTGSSDVVAGRVVGVTRTRYDVVVRIQVDRVWKGGAQPGTVIAISLYDGFLGDHQTPGRIGQRWLVFATPYAPILGRPESGRRHKQALMTGSCSGNWRITTKHPEPDRLAPEVPLPTLPTTPMLPLPTLP